MKKLAKSVYNLGDGWRSRGYIPHYDRGGISQFVTFRLNGSLPIEKLNEWKKELASIDEESQNIEIMIRIEEYLDLGYGPTWLKNEDVANIVQNALLHFDAERYCLHAWVIMPNHVHVLVTTFESFELKDIIHSWKSYSAQEANKVLSRKGNFWQAEYCDRYIRNERHYIDTVSYIENNPVKAGFCVETSDWLYSSARLNKDNTRF